MSSSGQHSIHPKDKIVPSVEIDMKKIHNQGSVGLLKNDGWQNIMTGVGMKGIDKRESTQFRMNGLLDWELLAEIYRGDGLAKKMVEIPAKDMLRAGWYVEGDTDHLIPKYLTKIGLLPALRKALIWSRLFGGALMILGVDDGNKNPNINILQTEINEENIRSLNFFRVYDRRQVIWYPTDIETDPTKVGYGRPKYYTVFPLTSGSSIFPMFQVHASRCLQFTGVPLPERETQQQQTWGDSILQALYSRLKGFAGAITATEDILDQFIVGVMEIDNLQGLIEGGNEQALISRLNQVDLSKHVMNTILVDKDEKFTRTSTTVNGIKDLLEFFKDVLSAVSGIPQVKLFGEQAQGLGSEAAGNIRLYYDDISDMQQELLRPHIERVVDLLLKSKEFLATSSRKLKSLSNSWEIKFNNLWQLSDKEVAEAHYIQSRADDLYTKNGTTAPKEIAHSRFGNKTYSFDTVLEVVDRDSIVPQIVKNPMLTPESDLENGEGGELPEKGGSRVPK